MNLPLLMFLVFVGLTLAITYWASRRSGTAVEFFSAGRTITGFQNGWAIAGDYMSAASFLGIAGLIAFFGYDGFMYSVGWLVAYLSVLLVVAEPLRNIGRFTLADVLAFRLRSRPVRAVAAASTLTISLLYMIAQMVGAGSLVSLLVPGIGFNLAIVIVGVLMLVYVIFGGMLATTWVQIIKAVLLMGGTILLSFLVLRRFDFSMLKLFDAVAHLQGTAVGADGVAHARNFTQPGLRYSGQWGPLDLMSLGVALIFGTAGLPHILVRFYTVPTAVSARTSVVWAMILIGSFYIMTTFLGFGAATLVGKANIGPRLAGEAAAAYITQHPDKSAALSAQLAAKSYIVPVPNNNLSAPLLAGELGGELLLAFVSAIAFATILAVVAGLTIASSTAFAHDLWANVIRRGHAVSDVEQVRVARLAAAAIGIVAIALGMLLKSLNVAFLVGLAFAVAASANVPSIVLTLFWRRFTSLGMITGMTVGLVSSVALIVVSPAVMGIDPPGAAVRKLIQMQPLFPLENPAIVSVPLGFIAAVLASLIRRDAEAEAMFPELLVRASTGLGAEA